MRRPGPTVDDRATIFEDQITAGTWRFEKKSADGRYEIRIFTGRAARERAIRYAARNDATFDVMRLKPHRRRSIPGRPSREFICACVSRQGHGGPHFDKYQGSADPC
jgi:hypothetical protein